MKNITFLTLFLALFFPHFANAAISTASKANQTLYEAENRSNIILSKNVIKKEKRLERIVRKIKKKVDKWQNKIKGNLTRWETKNYLYFCLGLLLVGILLFAISNVTVSFFSTVGIFALLGSVVFFVLWLLAYTGNL